MHDILYDEIIIKVFPLLYGTDTISGKDTISRKDTIYIDNFDDKEFSFFEKNEK